MGNLWIVINDKIIYWSEWKFVKYCTLSARFSCLQLTLMTHLLYTISKLQIESNNNWIIAEIKHAELNLLDPTLFDVPPIKYSSVQHKNRLRVGYFFFRPVFSLNFNFRSDIPQCKCGVGLISPSQCVLKDENFSCCEAWELLFIYFVARFQLNFNSASFIVTSQSKLWSL